MSHRALLRAIVSASIVVVLLGVADSIATGAMSPSTSRMLSTEELTQFRLVDARDVTTASITEQLGVGREEAEAKARDEIGSVTAVGDAIPRVLRARASRFVLEPAREVWVVIFSGGTSPFDGPPGAPELPPYEVTGVIIDAETGEFIRGFMN